LLTAIALLTTASQARQRSALLSLAPCQEPPTWGK
jgi:hypothetical protein